MSTTGADTSGGGRGLNHGDSSTLNKARQAARRRATKSVLDPQGAVPRSSRQSWGLSLAARSALRFAAVAPSSVWAFSTVAQAE